MIYKYIWLQWLSINITVTDVALINIISSQLITNLRCLFQWSMWLSVQANVWHVVPSNTRIHASFWMQLKNKLCFPKCYCHISISIKVTFQKIINISWLLKEKEKKKYQLYIQSKFPYHIHKHDKYVHDKYNYVHNYY